jgi:hypothetical protein
MLDPENPYKQVKHHAQPGLEELPQPNHPRELPSTNDEKMASAFLGALLGCGLTFLTLAELVKVGHAPFHQPLLLHNQLTQMIWWTCSVIAVGGFLFGLLCVVRLSLMRRRAFPGWLGTVMLVAFLAGLLGILPVALFTPEADMTRSDFVQSDISLQTGSSVTFVNPADGVLQVLCIGTNQQCNSDPGSFDNGPSQLYQGLRVLPGQEVSVVFDIEDDYHITSQSTANMNITIHVSTPRGGGGGG